MRSGFIVGQLHLHRAEEGRGLLSREHTVPWWWTLVTPVTFPPYQVQIALSRWYMSDAPATGIFRPTEVILFDGVKVIGEVVSWYVAAPPDVSCADPLAVNNRYHFKYQARRLRSVANEVIKKEQTAASTPTSTPTTIAPANPDKSSSRSKANRTSASRKSVI